MRDRRGRFLVGNRIGTATAVKPGNDLVADWASDPCRRCGKWPLAITNKTGYCRWCSRNHVSRQLYPGKPH